jgi:kynureninase
MGEHHSLRSTDPIENEACVTFRTDLGYARDLDAADELREFRRRFVIDDPQLIYVDGNSLGRLPRASLDRSRNLLERQWGSRLIRAWNDSWFHLVEKIGSKIARIIGADPDEVIVADSTSINLFKLVMAALEVRPDRVKLVTDDLNFPSDIYVFQSAINLARPNRHLAMARSPDGITVPIQLLEEIIDAQTALVALSHTAFKSGFVHDMAAVTALAHDRGALMLWDLSHSVGAVPVDLGESGVDLAVGCTYKYLNGGPGSPAFLYIRQDLMDHLSNAIAGWFGQENQFGFDLDYRPAAGLRKFLTGTPPISSLALIEPGVDLVLEAGLDRIRKKSIAQTEYLIELWETILAPLGFTLNSPREARTRGSHVSFGHPEGWRIDRALIDRMAVIPDFRRPDNIRIGVSPLYTTFEELHATATAMHRVVDDRLYEDYPIEQVGVT